MAKGSQFTNLHGTQLDSVEQRLSGVLKPVPPREEFVSSLNHRIQADNRPSFVNHLAGWHFLAMIIAGLVSLVILVAVGARALLALIKKKHPQMS